MRSPLLLFLVPSALCALSACSDQQETTASTGGVGAGSSGNGSGGAGSSAGGSSGDGSGGDATTTPGTGASGSCNLTPPAKEDGYLWFSGYEAEPWDSEWGLAWNQDSNHAVSSEGALFGQFLSRVTYPQGIEGSSGGAQYKVDFSSLQQPIPKSEHLYIRYYLKFDEDVDFKLGGKLPGLVGGDANTGGEKPNGFDGFSARLMWRSNGRLVQYLYHPDQEGIYGEDLDWNADGGSRYLIPGKWHCVESSLKMNTVTSEGEAGAQYDGELRSWFDGELALERTDLRFRYTEEIGIDSLYFSTFYGGSGDEWAPIKDEHASFDNFVIDDERIGCLDPCMLPAAPTPGPAPVTAASTTLVFNGDDPGWTTSDWGAADSNKDFANTEQARGGTTSLFVEFSPSAYDAVVFSSPSPINPSEYTHIRLWVRPVAKDVRFRLQFRGGSENSSEATVDGSFTYRTEAWIPGQWQEVIVPLADLGSVDGQSDLLIRSATNTATDAFWVDDVELIVAE